MFTLSPNDNPVSSRHGSGSLKDRKFGGNRQVTDNVQKAEDYTKPSLERRANVDGVVESELIRPPATDDLDDLNDPNAKKRETSRRAETANLDHSDRKFRPELPEGQEDPGSLQSDSDMRPKPEHREDDHVEPDPDAKHGTRNTWRFGEDHDKPGDQNIGTPAKEPR